MNEPLRVPRLARPRKIADPTIRRELEKHADAVADIQGRPVVDGFLVRDVSLTTARTVLKHGLKRLAHYQVVRADAAVSVYDETADRPLEELWLRASAPATVTLWIF